MEKLLDLEAIEQQIQDKKRYAYLKSIYGSDLLKLEENLFEVTCRVVEQLNNHYLSKGVCLKDKHKAVRIYHEARRRKFLDDVYETITTTVGCPQCQTREDVRNLFPPSIYAIENLSKRVEIHAKQLFDDLIRKSPQDLNKTIWAAERVNFSPLTK